MHDTKQRGLIYSSVLGFARMWRIHPQVACHVVRELDINGIADIEYLDENTKAEIHKVAIDFCGVIGEEEHSFFVSGGEYVNGQESYSALFVQIISRRMHGEYLAKESERLRGAERRKQPSVQKKSIKNPPPSSSSSSSSIDKSTSYSCPERKIKSAPEPPAFITIPLVHVNGGKPEEHIVTDAEVSEYESLFPAVDVKQQLRNIRAWNLSEPKKRKTRGGIRKHITSWLSKEQNRGGNKGQVAESTGRPVKVDREATDAATIGRGRNGK